MNFSHLTAFQERLADIGIAGSDVSVWRSGREVYRHQSGWADREAGVPMAANTIHAMYSMTKPVTCAAALILYERGQFLLDEPVSNYLGEFAHMRVRGADGELRVAERPIRIQDLFTMSAGLNYDLESSSILRLKAEKPNFTTREYAAAIAREPLDFEPGAHYQYSLCHDVLGALVEALSGQRLSEFCRREIFEPLGIQNAWFHVPAGEASRQARVYGPQEDGSAPLPWHNRHQPSENLDSGGAGLCATVDDYMKFARMLTRLGTGENGARILSRHTADMMRQNQLSGDRLRDFQDATKLGYGYGLGVRTLVNRALAGNPGAVGEFGWSGAAGTYLLCDPEWDLTIVFAEQTLPGHNAYTHRRIRNMVYAALE